MHFSLHFVLISDVPRVLIFRPVFDIRGNSVQSRFQCRCVCAGTIAGCVVCLRTNFILLTACRCRTCVDFAALCHHPLLSPRSPLYVLRDILVVVLFRVSYLPQLVTFLASSYSAQLLISAAIASSVSFSAVVFALVPLLAVSSAAVPMSYTFPPDDVAHASISV